MKKDKSRKMSRKQQELVLENRDFAMDLAKKYGNCGVDIDELQSASVEGLCDAAMRFDEARGVQFRTYAFDYCRWRIRKAIENEVPVRVPRKWRENVTMLHIDLSFDELGSADSDEGTDADRLLYGVAEPAHDEKMIADEQKAWVRREKTSRLTPTEQEVIDDIYGFGGRQLSHVEVAAQRGIGVRGVYKIEQRAVSKMRSKE